MQNTKDRNIEDNTKELCMACDVGNIEVLEDILSNREVDINGEDELGGTPLIHAVFGGHLSIVRRLHPGIRLGKRNRCGYTALHYACRDNKLSIVELLCQDSRCSPGVVNKKGSDGATPLMIAVRYGDLDIVKELDMDITDFSTKDEYGITLIEEARVMKKKMKDWYNAEILEYLIERNKVDSLKVIVAHNVVRYVEKKADVEALEIPRTMKLFLTRLVDDEE